MSAQNLPMDVWANVARYLPACERIPTFWALHRLGLIRKQKSIHESMILFLTHGARCDQQESVDLSWPSVQWSPGMEDILKCMGFAHDHVVLALTYAGGNCTIALDLLLQMDV